MNDAPQIITVTLNPAIDQTVFVDRLVPGTVHRATRSQRQAGGKGINVATMLALGGTRVLVTGFLGEDNAGIFERHFARHGLFDAFVRVPGETRTGVKVIDGASGDTTDFNLPGVTPAAEHLARLTGVLLDHARAGVWVVIAGSLPAGVDVAFLSGLIGRLRERGAKVAVDTSGAALAAAIEAGVDLAKPNQHELAELLGRPLVDTRAAIAAARALRPRLATGLIVSLGAEGALFLIDGEELLAAPPPVEVVSTVGAGDALLAGFLQAWIAGRPAAECARMATVCAWSRLESLEPALPAGEQLVARLAAVRLSAVE